MLQMMCFARRNSVEKIFCHFKHLCKKSSFCGQQLCLKRHKHLMNIYERKITESKSIFCQHSTEWKRLSCLFELSPFKHQYFSSSSQCMTPNDDSNNTADFQNDPMVKEFLDLIHDDFKVERNGKIESENNIATNINVRRQTDDHNNDSFSSKMESSSSLVQNNSELSEWLDYYEISDTEETTSDFEAKQNKSYKNCLYVTDLKHFIKKNSNSNVRKTMEDERDELTLTDSDESEASSSEVSSSEDSSSEDSSSEDSSLEVSSSEDSSSEDSSSEISSSEISSSEDSDSDLDPSSDSGSDGDSDQPSDLHKKAVQRHILRNDPDIKFPPGTHMDDLSGRYIELHHCDEDISHYTSDRVGSDSEFIEADIEVDEADIEVDEADIEVDEADIEVDEHRVEVDEDDAVIFEDDDSSSMNSTQVERFVYEEIDDFPDDFDDTEIDAAPWVPSISLTRGKYGVFDLEDMVTLLKTENLEDICVIRIPENLNFGDHMVIASAKSSRHLKAAMENVRKTHKMKKHGQDRQMVIEGLTNSKDWLASDLGNIILHIFLPATRKTYDLETLWTVGEEFDDKLTKPDSEEINEYSSNREWFQNLSPDWQDI